MGGHRKIGIMKLRRSDVIRKYMMEKQVKVRRRTKPENVEIENSIRRPQIVKRRKKNVKEVDACVSVLTMLAVCTTGIGRQDIYLSYPPAGRRRDCCSGHFRCTSPS